MSHEKEPGSDVSRLAPFRPYLQMLARMAWDWRLGAKLDPSDIVQETLVEAQRKLSQFQGATDAELAAWLRRILANELAQARRTFRQEKRDLLRENSYEDLVEQSSMRLAGLPAGDDTSPSMRAEFNERALRIAAAVESLPEGQREAVVLHYFQDLTLPEIAERVQKSTTAVAGLVHRGLKTLRSTLSEDI
ncbi:MAG: sigma-70 family RNA polymerase sigma factor [Planctomycetes bacterium]|nr:sigma-70 family RNA polymerase sigma factor [Planctomycetota bacterium]